MSEFAAFAKANDDGSYELTCLVSGIHCASCIQLIENALISEPDVSEARVNMTTNRLRVVWRGDAERADQLAQKVIKLGYKLKPFDAAEDEKDVLPEEKFLLRCMAISGFAMGNIMLISVGLWTSSGESMGMATRDFFHWISALIALPTIIYAGQPFFRSAWSVLKTGHTNMDVPISIAITLASGMSLVETISHGEHVYFDSAVMLLFFLLIGRYLDERAKGKARETAKELLSMLSGSATVVSCCGKQSSVPIKGLREGMVVLVAMGDNIPADGVVVEGKSEIDKSLINGETLPEVIREGSYVFAGTNNISAPIKVKIAKASEDSLLSDIVRLMEKAEQGQAKYVRLADKAARLYTPVVHTLGLLTFLYWWQLGGLEWQPALMIAITVLIITCPCALGLAVPVVQVLASGKLMKRGILLKSGDALEKLAGITAAVFDKTGTLTLGKPSLDSGMLEAGMQEAASLAAHSKHPLSKALKAAYDGELLPVQEVVEHPGKGLEGVIAGEHVKLGSRNWCGDGAAENSHHLEIWLNVDGEPVTRFTFEDQIKTDAKSVLQKLKQSGLKLMLLSGDRAEAVQNVANELGLEDARASLTPPEKTAIIEEMSKTERVLMIGDGLNDAPSLAAAHVSMSPSSAIDIAQNTADIVFQGDTLAPILTAWHVAKKAQQLVKENFALAVIYNLIAIPLAVMGHVTPLIAALAMSGSSLLVIGNSFRLNLKGD